MRIAVPFIPVFFVALFIAYPGLGEPRPRNTSTDWIAEMRNGAWLDQTGRYAEAEPVFVAIAPMLQDTTSLPADDPIRAELANDLAAHAHRLGRYEEAESLYLQAIGIWRKAEGEDAQRNRALAIGNLAALD